MPKQHQHDKNEFAACKVVQILLKVYYFIVINDFCVKAVYLHPYNEKLKL